MSLRFNTQRNYPGIAEIVIIVLLACVPLFVTFPYRVNIFLSWEGAYRISQGELPFRDFGTPLGGMFWVIPGIFFKIFGPQMITLVKAQVFINIISGLAFRSILKSCGVQPGIRFVSVLLYCLSFSFFNFWPWYNHTVIVYEFVGLAFLFKAMTREKSKWTIPWLVLATFFTVCSLFTKQDAGALAFMLSFVLIGYNSFRDKKWMPLIIYTGSFIAILCLFILPFRNHEFGYWFNHGQAPHSARISLFEIIDEFFTGSQWIKFYIFLVLVILVIRFRSWKQLWEDRRSTLFLLLTLGILAQAAIFQVTSYTPPDNNVFFHSFAIAFILTLLSGLLPVNLNKLTVIAAYTAGLLIWWSSVYWKYIQRIAQRALPATEETVSATGENVITKKSFMILPKDTTDVPLSDWKFSGLKSFDKIYMPQPTIDGMKRLLSMDLVKNTKDLRVLNMSELTPLAVEMPYKLEKGSHYPLWYHLGVGMFNKQAEMFEKKIVAKEYDLVLFEYIPTLNNFYPFRVRDTLINHYQKVDSFYAPRRGDVKGYIEVYVKP
jgi:hypothetical protein